MRTRKYPTKQDLLDDLAKEPGATAPVVAGKSPLSWLAIPFLSPEREPVLVLFADSPEFNFFVESGRTEAIVRMCWGYCRLIDYLDANPFPTLRNFAFEPAPETTGGAGVFGVQEPVSELAVPRFERVRSFNFEASVG